VDGYCRRRATRSGRFFSEFKMNCRIPGGSGGIFL